MPFLHELTRLIRSKNAGPFSLTVDILFKTEEGYRKVLASNVLDRRFFAAMFKVSENAVRIFHYDPAKAIKVTVPRYVVSGNVDDPDVFGGQQYAQLVDLEIPDPA